MNTERCPMNGIEMDDVSNATTLQARHGEKTIPTNQGNRET